MRQKTFYAISCSLLLFFTSFSQEYKRKYKALAAAKDTAGQRLCLNDWAKLEPNDPDLCVAWFNFYVQKASTIKEVVNEKTQRNYNSQLLARAYGFINKGIADFPNRLDMRFGKIYLLGETKNYKEYTAELIKTLEQSVKNKNAWLWANNVRQATAQDFMLANINEYALLVLAQNETNAWDYAKQISEAVQRYYPDYGESPNTIGKYYLLKKQQDQALNFFLKADQLMPEDASLLETIAGLYISKNQKPEAIAYYHRLLRHGDEAAKDRARKQIEELSKK